VSNTEGFSNVFIGNKSGSSNIGVATSGVEKGSWNTFVGHLSGELNTEGNANCFYGKYSGHDNTVGKKNCFYGSHSGQQAGVGGVLNNYNCIFGDHAGENFNSGEYNVFIGYNSQNPGVGSPGSWGYNLDNAIAIGANTMVPRDNQMILGSNNVNVGIGLSHDVSTVFGFPGPRAKLEINADPNSMTPNNGFNQSGLRFRQLTSASTIAIAPYGKVLTVDAEGDVVLTEDHIGYGVCRLNGPVDLPDHIGMRFRNFNIYHDGQGYEPTAGKMNNSFGIGYECEVDLPAKLSVNQEFLGGNVDVPTIAGYFHNGDETPSASFPFEKKGVHAICDGLHRSDGSLNVGGDFEGANASLINIGVRGRTRKDLQTTNAGLYNFGGHFYGTDPQGFSNMGVVALTDGRGSSFNYGIYAFAPPGVCNDGFLGSTDCPAAAGFFNGDVYTTSAVYHFSDSNFKDNILPLENGLSLIRNLNPKTYSFKQQQHPYLSLTSGIESGLIAQELLSVLPQLVNDFKLPPRIDSLGNLDTTGTNSTYLAINYTGLIPYLIGAIQEQQLSIDSLHIQLSEVVTEINLCCSLGLRMRDPENIDLGKEENKRTHIKIELADLNTIILDQNSPNPFSEETFINYTIPKDVLKATIMIYDNSGQVLKTVTISERGKGQLHIYAEKLSSGIYSYSLIADGKTIDTKKMVCQK
jgi:hypothetical protein